MSLSSDNKISKENFEICHKSCHILNDIFRKVTNLKKIAVICQMTRFSTKNHCHYTVTKNSKRKSYFLHKNFTKFIKKIRLLSNSSKFCHLLPFVTPLILLFSWILSIFFFSFFSFFIHFKWIKIYFLLNIL